MPFVLVVAAIRHIRHNSSYVVPNCSTCLIHRSLTNGVARQGDAVVRAGVIAAGRLVARCMRKKRLITTVVIV